MKRWDQAAIMEPKPDSNPGSGSPPFQIMKDSVQVPNNLPAWSIQEGKGNLEIRFRYGKRHKSLSSGTRSRREAQGRAPALIARWLASRPMDALASAWEKTVEAFRTEVYADQKATTWEGVETTLRRLVRVYRVAGPHQLTPELFRQGLRVYRGKASPKYWTEILSVTRKFCRWAVDRRLMAADATEGIPYPDKGTFGRREGVWAEEYLGQVLAVLEPDDRDRVLVMRWTGIDSGDLFTFDPGKHLTKDQAGHPVLKKRREKGKSDDETIIQPLSSEIRPSSS